VSAFHDFVLELFAGLGPDLGPVRIKRMFGGAGVYAGEQMFGLIDDDVIYLKVDDALRAELEAEGARSWLYVDRKTNQPQITSYWSLPQAALDDPDEAAAWGRKSLAVARTLAGAKKRRPAKKKSAAKRRS